jgi:hypothetical protein
MKIKFRCLPELKAHIPEPLPAPRGLPQWLKDMPSKAASEVLGGADVRTLKHCAPLLDAMASGVIFVLPCDVEVRNGGFSWNWDLPRAKNSRHTRSPIGVHVPEQATGLPGQTATDFIIKFNNFWTMETEAGVSTLFVHPLNRMDLPFRSFSGVVDTDNYSNGLVHFPAQWIDASFEGVLPRGTPVAQAIPFRREQLELDIDSMRKRDVELYMQEQDLLQADPGHYRKTRRASRT